MSGERPLDDVARVAHGQGRALDAMDEEARALKEIASDQSDTLDTLLSQAAGLLAAHGGELPRPVPAAVDALPTSHRRTPTWDQLVARYDVDASSEIRLDDLLTPAQLAEIGDRFRAPLARLPWDRGDHLAVFLAALAGIIADAFCAPVENPVSGRIASYGASLHDKEGVYKAVRRFQGWLADTPLARMAWVDRLASMKISHHHLPVDYSGRHFGGKYHRVLSGGHDLLRFLSGIWQIRNGQFVGVRYEDGVAVMVIRSVSHGKTGSSYVPKDWDQAAIEYFLHLFADFFTKTSLPVPGMTLLREMPNRELRTFVVKLYEEGYNLRHVVGQGVTPAVTQLVLWLYEVLRYRLPRWWAQRRGTDTSPAEPVPGLRHTEMRSAAHVLVTAVNVGKVVITDNPTLLNLSQIAACTKAVAACARGQARRHDHRARLERNRVVLDDCWVSLEEPLDLSGLPSLVVG